MPWPSAASACSCASGEVALSAAARAVNRLDGAALMRRKRLHGFEEVRQQRMAVLELDVDVGERALAAAIERHEPVVRIPGAAAYPCRRQSDDPQQLHRNPSRIRGYVMQAMQRKRYGLPDPEAILNAPLSRGRPARCYVA